MFINQTGTRNVIIDNTYHDCLKSVGCMRGRGREHCSHLNRHLTYDRNLVWLLGSRLHYIHGKVYIGKATNQKTKNFPELITTVGTVVCVTATFASIRSPICCS